MTISLKENWNITATWCQCSTARLARSSYPGIVCLGCFCVRIRVALCARVRVGAFICICSLVGIGALQEGSIRHLSNCSNLLNICLSNNITAVNGKIQEIGYSYCAVVDIGLPVRLIMQKSYGDDLRIPTKAIARPHQPVGQVCCTLRISRYRKASKLRAYSRDP